MFVLGMLFIEFFLPIIESIRDLILTGIENLKSQLAVGICKNNQIINNPNGDKRIIGFVAPDEEQEEEDDD